MIFDTTTANRHLKPRHDIGEIPSCHNAISGICIWEEHCVECGQPECFKVCQKFMRGYDGKCARLRYGIVPYKNGVWVSFKEWGKLEGCYSGVVARTRVCSLLFKIEQCISTVARIINRLMCFVPGRIGAITVWRRFRKWLLMPFSSQEKKSFVFAGKCWASEDVELTFTVFQGNREIYLSRIEMKHGWNEFNFSLPPIEKGARILLFPVKETTTDIFFAQLALRLPCSEEKVAKKEIAPAIGAAEFVKCLAWDLDNTLWKGILVEDGAENLVLREEAVTLIKELDRRGILNTICSKNDYEAAWAQLEKFGISEYFVFPEINWLPKSGNLKHIAKSINININTFAFVDDSVFERGEVRESLPMVRIFKETELELMAKDAAFNPPVSEESSQRRLSYLKEMARQKVQRNFEGDYEAFLKSCEIKLELRPISDEKTKLRCWELVQRSNQLNLTSKRYKLDEFDCLIKGNGVSAYAIHCEDKFGDYGIVGFVAIVRCEENVQVTEFVVSCRVAKKKCEQSILLTLAGNAFEDGAKSFFAELVETGRNGALIDAFKDMPFSVKDVIGKKHYTLQCSDMPIDFFCHQTNIKK